MKPQNTRKIKLAFADLGLAVACYLAIMLVHLLSKWNLAVSSSPFTWWRLLVFLGCLAVSRLAFKIYHRLWRYATVNTFLRLVVADAVSGLAFLLISSSIDMLFKDNVKVPRFGISYSLALAMSVLIATLCTRFFYQRVYNIRSSREQAADETKHLINVAIVGAGNVGAGLAEYLSLNPKAHYKPICFVDRDPQKIGKNLNGIPVLADDEEIVAKLREMPVQEIIVAMPELTPAECEIVYEKFKSTRCAVKLYDYSLSERRPASIREFRIEDLLFRKSIQVQNAATEQFYTGKTVLVTGGGGSIGSELCRQIAKQNPKKLVILDIYENNAYDIEQELMRTYGSLLNLQTMIASVRDLVRMEEIFSTVRPDIVVNAAAHKHVPLMENNPAEAIKNNVFGTYNCVVLAEKYGAKKFLQISTDKAVNPTNIMGASKRLCEMIVQSRADSETEFSAVRFGNVLGSNGSVIPLFRRQIERGGPVTITDKRIIRYFMTIPEAVGLVLEACAMAKKGDLFVLDMGKPVKIIDLAENMIRMAGYIPYRDIDIVEVGLRPGEKLYEELLIQSEELSKTDNDLIFVEHDRAPTRDEVEQKLAILREAVKDGSATAIVKAVRDTVPTYRTPEEVNCHAEDSKEMKETEKAANADPVRT